MKAPLIVLFTLVAFAGCGKKTGSAKPSPTVMAAPVSPYKSALVVKPLGSGWECKNDDRKPDPEDPQDTVNNAHCVHRKAIVLIVALSLTDLKGEPEGMAESYMEKAKETFRSLHGKFSFIESWDSGRYVTYWFTYQQDDQPIKRVRHGFVKLTGLTNLVMVVAETPPEQAEIVDPAFRMILETLELKQL